MEFQLMALLSARRGREGATVGDGEEHLEPRLEEADVAVEYLCGHVRGSPHQKQWGEDLPRARTRAWFAHVSTAREVVQWFAHVSTVREVVQSRENRSKDARHPFTWQAMCLAPHASARLIPAARHGSAHNHAVRCGAAQGSRSGL